MIATSPSNPPPYKQKLTFLYFTEYHVDGLVTAVFSPFGPGLVMTTPEIDFLQVDCIFQVFLENEISS